MSFSLATILRESRQVRPDRVLCHVGDLSFSHGRVDEISGVAVIGRPDERLGEEIVACVRLHPDTAVIEQEIMAFRKYHLAACEHPREIRFLDTLPVGPTGKILKKEPCS